MPAADNLISLRHCADPARVARIGWVSIKAFQRRQSARAYAGASSRMIGRAGNCISRPLRTEGGENGPLR